MMSQLLDEALPLDEAGRRAWLRRLSPEHRYLASALRRALLPEAAETVRVSALMTLPKLGSPDEAKSASGLKPGARVGPYELIRPLGSGGMAEVWLARRADGAFTREVALKLPIFMHRRGDLEPRFARERDILASLEHPQIARLYDAGGRCPSAVPRDGVRTGRAAEPVVRYPPSAYRCAPRALPASAGSGGSTRMRHRSSIAT